ncbi:MAG: hypothetical protein D3909_05295 [Candidatus Electrothrix sp. ATG1]|nr:hypothetical protein [Candidatus Electrothrix sp. ATG1]
MYSANDNDDKISLIAEKISQGRIIKKRIGDRLLKIGKHDSYRKHVVGQRNRGVVTDLFTDKQKFIQELGINGRDKFKQHLEKILKDPSTISFRATNDREIYYSRHTNTMVIYNPHSEDKGTCWRPRKGERDFYKAIQTEEGRGNTTRIVTGGYAIQQEANKLADLEKKVNDRLKESKIERKETYILEDIKKKINEGFKGLEKPHKESIFGEKSNPHKINKYISNLQKKIKDTEKELKISQKNKIRLKKYANDNNKIDKKNKTILSDCQKSKNGDELIKRLKKRGYTAVHDKVTGRIVLVDKKGVIVDLEKVIKDGKKQKELPADYKTGIDKKQLPDLEEVRKKNVGKEQSFDDSENPDINKKRQAILSDCMRSKDGKALTKRLEKRGYTLALNSENRHILVVDYKGRTIDLTEILEEGRRQGKVRESVVIKKENLPDVAEVQTENLKKLKKKHENFINDAAADRKDINSVYDKKRSEAKNGGDNTRIELDRDIELKNNDKKLKIKIQRFEKRQETKMVLREKSLSRGLGM